MALNSVTPSRHPSSDFLYDFGLFLFQDDIGQLIQTLLKNKGQPLVLANTVILSNRFSQHYLTKYALCTKDYLYLMSEIQYA